MKFSLQAIALVAAVAAPMTAVHAVAITGTITYISADVPDNSDLNLATSLAFFPAGIVVSATGDLVGVGGTVLNAPSISGLPLGVGPAPGSVPILGLWSGGDFNFDLLSLTVDYRSDTQFTATGTGLITALGFDPTPGVWTFATTGAGPVLGFSAGVTAVPEPQAFAAIGGFACAAFALYRRRK